MWVVEITVYTELGLRDFKYRFLEEEAALDVVNRVTRGTEKYIDFFEDSNSNRYNGINTSYIVKYAVYQEDTNGSNPGQ